MTTSAPTTLHTPYRIPRKSVPLLHAPGTISSISASTRRPAPPPIKIPTTSPTDAITPHAFLTKMFTSTSKNTTSSSPSLCVVTPQTPTILRTFSAIANAGESAIIDSVEAATKRERRHGVHVNRDTELIEGVELSRLGMMRKTRIVEVPKEK